MILCHRDRLKYDENSGKVTTKANKEEEEETERKKEMTQVSFCVLRTTNIGVTTMGCSTATMTPISKIYFIDRLFLFCGGGGGGNSMASDKKMEQGSKNE